MAGPPCSSGSDRLSVGELHIASPIRSALLRFFRSLRLQKIWLYFHHWPQGGLSSNTNLVHSWSLPASSQGSAVFYCYTKRAILLHYERDHLLDQTTSTKK